ncbi:MAG: heme-binding protein [Alphaproteobacteria bacterium]|nr:heme-binding protein [Alphaproteobacteria bacterium]
MTRTIRTLAAAFILALAALAVSGAPAMAVEEPPHAVLARDGKFELRRYAPMVVAEVVTTGARYQAVNAGFRPLARYIFGGNTPGAKIAMTSPVTQTGAPAGRDGKGEKIAMTAPVAQTKQGDAWTIRFVMPAGSTLATMPAPNDPSVKLLEEPARTVATLRFSGLATDKDLARKTDELMGIARARRLEPVGPVTFAYYDPPWTPPFMRRNEVMVEVRAPS